MAEASDWLDPDRAYAIGDFVPGSDEIPPRWAAAAAAFRDRMGGGMSGLARADLPYGPDPRQQFDLFLPDAGSRGLLVFVHGGYWLEFSRKDWSHLAAGALGRGWAVAVPSYRLAPEVRVADIVGDVRAAVTAAAREVAGPVVVTGHSAGGHLAARMGCEDGPAGVARVVPISPVAELAPVMKTDMQARLKLSEDEVAAESPARRKLAAGVAAHVWVGGEERPSFLWQARVLAEAWGRGWTVDAGRNHFDVIDGLADPGSALIEACLGGL